MASSASRLRLMGKGSSLWRQRPRTVTAEGADLRLDDQSVLTRRESAVEKWTDTLQAGVTSLLRTMDPPADAE